MTFAPVHLPIKNNRIITKNNINSLAYPLKEIKFASPFTSITELANKQKRILQVINYLDVEKSLRYQPRNGKTFCNIYSYDLLMLLDAYIPRVWWKKDILKDIIAGYKPEVKYSETVIELNTNSIYDWLIEFGDSFNWKEVNSFQALSKQVKSAATVGIVCSKNSSGHGHLGIVYSAKNCIWLTRSYLTDAGESCHKRSRRKWWKENPNYSTKYFYLT